MDLGQFPKPNLPPRPLLIGTAIAAVAVAIASLTCCCGIYRWAYPAKIGDEYFVTIKSGDGPKEVRDYESYRASRVVEYIKAREHNPDSVDASEVRAIDDTEEMWLIWYRATNKNGALVKNKRVVWFTKTDGRVSYFEIGGSEEAEPDEGW